MRGQCGQVSEAMNKPAASPIRWLLADECCENQPRTKCACSYTERSHIERKSARFSNTLECAPPRSCHAADQLMRRSPASSALAQFGP